MMKYPIKTVHGHSHSDLENLLEDSCDAFNDFINIDQISMGGWSNINIRGNTSGYDFVLKLPKTTIEFKHNPYEKLYKIDLYFSRLDLAAHPIEIGRLSDSIGTPFYLVEYVDGTTHNEVAEASEDELLSLKESLRILKEQKPSGLPRYESPSDYLIANHEQVENHVWLSKASVQTQSLLDKYDLLFPRVKNMTDILGYWSGEVMHGDLWIPNVVFRSEQNALLLDFEVCAFGDSRYDLASLLEVHMNTTTENIPSLIQYEDIDMVNSLRPLVLSYVIDWSLERLLSMESGIIEPNLNTKEIRTIILGYVEEKIDRLRSLLH